MPPTTPPRKPLDLTRETLQTQHYSIRTERAYLNWVKRFILFHNKRHPKEMGSAEIETFVTHLAVHGKVAASTQNQALSALLFLYREVLKQDLGLAINAVRARPSQRLPTVLTREEAQQILQRLTGTH